MPLIGCCDGRVAVYASFGSTPAVVNAINLGWTGIADTGGIGTQTSPYTTPIRPDGITTVDQMVQNAYAQLGGVFWWLSFWTVSWPAPGDTYLNAGTQGGKEASQTIQNTFGAYMPAYVILDPEGYNTKASTPSQWADFINGFANGVRSVNSDLRPAFYCDESDYLTFNLNSLSLPGFIAVTPILNNTPDVSGPNISGYIAYYASCPSGQYVDQVTGWNARWNTIQFSDSGVDCGPQ